MTRALWAVAVLSLASGCATSSSSVRQLQAELGTLRAEVATLRQAHDEHTRNAAALRASPRAGDGRGPLAQHPRRDGGRCARARRSVGTVEDGVKSPRGDAAAVRPAPVAQTATPAPPPSPPAPAPAPAERAARDGAARESGPRTAMAETAYQTALAAFRAREYGQAVLEFLDFLGKYPKHSLAANAQYWIGEAYYIQRDWRQSLIEFQRVLDYNASQRPRRRDAPQDRPLPRQSPRSRPRARGLAAASCRSTPTPRPPPRRGTSSPPAEAPLAAKKSKGATRKDRERIDSDS